MSRDSVEQRLAEAERKIDDQTQQLKDMQRKIDAAIQTAQQTILTDSQLRQGGNLSRGEWAYSRASAESALRVTKTLGGSGNVYKPQRRNRRLACRKRNSGFIGFLRGLTGLVR